MKKQNYFAYQLSDTSKISGYFAIYQGRNGAIVMVMGNNSATLTLDQIEKLDIELYSMDSFNIDDYKKYYKIK